MNNGSVVSPLRWFAVAASSTTIDFLRSLEPSDAWKLAIVSTRPGSPTIDWLEDLGDRISMHSSVGDLFGVHRAEISPYLEAARIGFVSIDFALGVSGTKFAVKQNRESGHRLVGDVCFHRASDPLPLAVIDSEMFEFVSTLVDSQIATMERIAGGSPDKNKGYFSFDPVPFSVSLWDATHSGALMAAIGHDPSGCHFYDGLFFNKVLRNPRDVEWYAGPK